MHSGRLFIALVAIFAVCVGAGTARAQCGCGGMGKGNKGNKGNKVSKANMAHMGKEVHRGKKATGPRCPVSGAPIDLTVKTATRDGSVYFCSEGCIQKYRATPRKFAGRVAVQRKAAASLPKTQVNCPVTRKPVDQDISIKHQGLELYFCCDGCIPKYKEEPKKYKATLADSYTFQTECPVRGGDIDPKVFVVGLSNGQKVFFCCVGCDKRFLSNPAKYAPNLEAQGIKITPGKLEADQKDDSGKGNDNDPQDHGGHDH